MNAKQMQVVEVLPPAPMLGVNLVNPGETVHAANQATKRFKRSGKTRTIVSGKVDFAALGTECAEYFIGADGEAQAAIREVQHQQRLTYAFIWQQAAEYLTKADKPEEAAKTMSHAFRDRLEAEGHKGYKTKASEFKVYLLAYLKSPTEVVGIMDDLPYNEAITELRAIRDSDKERKERGEREPRKPTEQAMSKIMEAIGRMDAKQLTMIYKCGQSRNKTLKRDKREFCEAFAK